MGRKRTAEEYNRAATQNGWVPRAHEEEDQIEYKKDDPGDRYKANQQESLDQWVIFMSSQGVDASECLREKCPPPSNVLLKDFARWYTKSRPGRLGSEPNEVSIKNILKKFYSGFERVTGTEIPQELRNDIYYWIRNVLLKQGNSTTQKREKYLFDVDDLVNVIVTLWTEDDSIFIHECMRVQMTFLILAYCFTGARVGAYLENGVAEVKRPDGKVDKLVFKGLTWKDVYIYLFPLPDGRTERVVKIVQRWTKNNKDPEHTVNEIPTYEHGKLRFDITAFLLPLVFRDDVLIGIKTIQELDSFQVPEGDSFLELRKDPSKLNMPVLRPVSRHNGVSDRMLDASTFRYYFQRIVLNAGYWGELTVHSLRRAVANVVDETATPGERNKVLGWAASDVGDREYISNLCRIPVQDRFLRGEAEKPHDDYVRKLRSVSTKRAKGLPQKLPANEIDKALEDPTTNKLYQELLSLRERGASSPTIREARLKFRAYQRWVDTQAKARWKEQWLDNRYNQIIQTRGRISNNKNSATHNTEALFRVMPERGRWRCQSSLTHLVPVNRCCQMWQTSPYSARRTLKLCIVREKSLSTGLAQYAEQCFPRLRGVGLAISMSVAANSSRRRREKGVQVRYCFLCFNWFAGDLGWEEHCRDHLVSMTLKSCAARVYCHTLIVPGLCCWCFNSEGLPAAERLKQYERNSELADHMYAEHVDKVTSWPAHCGCKAVVECPKSMRHHISDEHGVWRTEWKNFRKRQVLEEDSVEDRANPAGSSDAELTVIHSRDTGPIGKSPKRVRWASFCEEPMPGQSVQSRQVLPLRKGTSSKTDSKLKAVQTAWFFIDLSPLSAYDFAEAFDEQFKGQNLDQPIVPDSLIINLDPELEEDTVIQVPAQAEDDQRDKETPEAELDSHGLLELTSEIQHQSGSIDRRDFTEGPLWIDYVSGTESSTAGSILVSTPITDPCSDVFEQYLDPALFGSESLESPLYSSPEAPQDAKTFQ